MDRMIISISFKDKADYLFVKNHPNSSHYIRELVKKDRRQLTAVQPKQDFKEEVSNVFKIFD